MLGPLMIDVPGLTLTRSDLEILRHPLVGGVILFARNYDSVPQLEDLINEIQRVRSPQLLVAVDQEGGRVQRFKRDFFNLAPLSKLGTIYMRDPAAALVYAEKHAWMMASELRAIGVDFSFAPVLDLRSSNKAIGTRAFHRAPEVVTTLAHGLAEGMAASGMSAVGKHFPGHSGVIEDPHDELPRDDRSIDDLRDDDMRVYRDLKPETIQGVMSCHVCFPRIDGLPASLSYRFLTEELRDRLFFQGPIFSDDLMMGALDSSG